MAGKSKFQISRVLDERLRKLTHCPEECEQEFTNLAGAFILGLNYANVTNYVGLTTDFKLHNATYPVVGRAYFKVAPSEQQIKTDLVRIWEHFYNSPDGIGCNAKVDKNQNLFLIYFKSEETSQADRKIFDFNAGIFLDEQPALAIVEDAKIYSHSAIVKLSACLKLAIFEGDNKVADKNKLTDVIEEAKATLSSGKGLKLHLTKSSFTTTSPLSDGTQIENLYAYLEVPTEVQQMGDYMPQMSKEERKKLATKWRNKVKDQRQPMEINLEQNGLSLSPDDKSAEANYYKLNLEEYLYLQVNDSVAKGSKYIVMLLRQKLEMIKRLLIGRIGESLEQDEIKSCTFKLPVNHLVHSVYLVPRNEKPNYVQLAKCRETVHHSYLLPLDRPIVRYSQRVLNVTFKTEDEQKGYLCNVHADIQDKSGIKGGTRSIIGGTYTYHHYLQDRAQDSGWGCAYRSLQTIISWFKHQGYIYTPDVEPRTPLAGKEDKTSSLRAKLHSETRVPTHEEIQSVLVDVGDKPASFIGSQKWIGSQEVCYVLNHLYNLDSKFISVSSGGELVYRARDLGQHFSDQSTPVMIGGGVLAHTIIGLDFNEKNGDISYLILDPHYTGAEELTSITKKGWCGWKKNAFWDKNSFYNLCLPQRPVEF